MRTLMLFVALFVVGCDAGEEAPPMDGGVDRTKNCQSSGLHNVKCDGGVCKDTFITTCTWPE